MASTNSNMTAALPQDFTPDAHSVVIGKGKKFYHHAGNQWLRQVVANQIPEYKEALTKAEKSSIISLVVEYVEEHGNFVKLDATGKWIFAEPLLCREKVSQTFRDNLAETYRSSNVAKRNKRRQEQQEKTPLCAAESLTMEMPPLKRMRTITPVLEKQSFGEFTAFIRQVSDISTESDSDGGRSSPADWFDWEMPIRELESPNTGSMNMDTERISPQRRFSSFVGGILCEDIFQSGIGNLFDDIKFDNENNGRSLKSRFQLSRDSKNSIGFRQNTRWAFAA